MPKVFFIRHAKSSWDHPGLSDHDRPLNDRGLRDAPRMAAYLKSNNFEIDFIVSSTANRAIMTANAFQMEFGIETKRFWTDPDLYHSSPDTIVLSLCQIPPEFTNIAVFAHNPGMTLLANKVSEEYIENIPTCGVNVCATSKPLCDISIDDLSMTHLFTPKSIDR